MNLRKHLHDRLGSMYVMEDHNGVWFKIDDIFKCLGYDGAHHSYVYNIPVELKRMEYCELQEGKRQYGFIHEDAVYGIIVKHKNRDFQEWFRDIMELTKGTGDLVNVKTIIAIDNELNYIKLKHLMRLKMRTKCDKK